MLSLKGSLAIITRNKKKTFKSNRNELTYAICEQIIEISVHEERKRFFSDVNLTNLIFNFFLIRTKHIRKLY